MKKNININEVRQLQRVAGILREEDLDLSDTPEFDAPTPGVKLLDFVSDLKDVEKYEHLGFTIEVDDPANREFSAELDLAGYDALALLAVLEDCEREGLEPMLIYKDSQYPFAQALKMADKLAAKNPERKFR